MTGCRRGEALGLRWDDVNLKTGSVRIMRSRTGYGISTPKTKTSTRGVDLDPGTTALKAWRRAQRLERVKAGPGWEDSNLVFTREDGLGYHPDAVTAMFGRKVGRLKVNPITLHGLRHTHATLLLAAGENPRVVSERLGHSSVGLYPPGLCARPTRPPACDGGTLRRSDRGLGSAH